MNWDAVGPETKTVSAAGKRRLQYWVRTTLTDAGTSGAQAVARYSERLAAARQAARAWLDQRPWWIKLGERHQDPEYLRQLAQLGRIAHALRDAGVRTMHWTRAHPLLASTLAISVTLGLAVIEIRTSFLEAHLMASFARGSAYRVESGPSPRIRFPVTGPYDERLGYARLPTMIDRLQRHGFDVIAQARVTRRLAALADVTGVVLFREKSQTGLDVRDRSGRPLFRAPHPRHVYSDFDSVPPLLVRSLLYLENRELLGSAGRYRNPAIEWDRLSVAAANFTQATLFGSRHVFGASTLATQMEKFRHSPGGVTRTPADKARQMIAASLRAYLDGPVTIPARHRLVIDYLNSLPIGAAPGHGEVIGLSDGLWAWFGIDFEDLNRLLRTSDTATTVTDDEAYIYRATLALLLAQRRPGFYLTHPKGPDALARLTDRHLRGMASERIISAPLARKALQVRATPLARAPDVPPIPFVERKAANAIRIRLLELLGAPSLAELDKYDLTVRSTVDAVVQRAVVRRLERLHDPQYLRAHALDGPRLLGSGDPGAVIYSLALYERTPFGNAVRLQTDNLDTPFDLNVGARLELGSTAKLRTLVTYLERVEELHAQLGAAHAMGADPSVGLPSDPITRWGIEYHLAHPGHTLRDMLDASLQRVYSASPRERFFTGSGVHVFANFDRESDHEKTSVREAFAQSGNLVFVRLMRDVLWYEASRLPGLSADSAEAALALLARHPRGRDRARFIAIEQEAFKRIHQSWRRTGYPYHDLVPSLATSIGSSGDRPEALSELVGILLNDGMRLPFVYLEEVRFGMRTPYETAMRLSPQAGRRVLSSDVAAAARGALVGVVETGSARMLRNSLRSAHGTHIAIGGKTGTGQNRVKVFARSLRVLEERSVNRTASFVFFIDDRFFGAVTAYVPGPESASYGFTSSLPVRLLRLLLDDLTPVLMDSEQPLYRVESARAAAGN
jgi:membrane peptidoglycan carboxypeptidase